MAAPQRENALAESVFGGCAVKCTFCAGYPRRSCGEKNCGRLRQFRVSVCGRPPLSGPGRCALEG